ncbi:hypothetical protein GWI33_018745 [Rhynchophorus ferrugineus]|uniref:Major facilitator superfamily (MFS) profile domain-containing protein n=1 Tax=Rhynchophorus ferrugineus TaxID=354439 RepID=A0A834HV77_RHYFE|nr:hypothetical protein GWI33_018745 [Rhynchophorus ferrugineus]
MKVNILERFLAKEDGKQLTQYLAVISATLTLFSVGIYQGWSGPSLVKILSDEYPIPISQEEASYITIIGSVGHIVGGFLAGFLSDSIGRKLSIISISIPQILSLILIYFSDHSKILLYVARVLQGIGEGAGISIVPCYIGEIAEPSVRGVLGVFMAITISGGSFFTLHEAAIICLIVPLLFLLTFTSMPESPYFNLMKKDYEGAKISLQMLRRKNSVEKELLNLTVDVDRQMSERGNFRDLLANPSNRKAFMIVSLMRTFQGYTGFGAFVSYNQIMITETTDISPILGSSLLLTVNMIMMYLSSTYIEKIGRRLLFILSSGLCFSALIFQAVFLTVRDYTTIDLTFCSWLPFVIVFFFNIFFCGGLGPGVNIFISEIYSTSIKARALCLGSIVFCLTNIGSTKLYQLTATYIGMAVPFYLFAFITFCGLMFFIWCVPETRGKSLEAIQQELKGENKLDLI